MRERSSPQTIKSVNNTEYHCLKGLSTEGRQWAKAQIKKAEDNGSPVFYGIIRSAALKM